jgi:hypothetical protein
MRTEISLEMAERRGFVREVGIRHPKRRRAGELSVVLDICYASLLRSDNKLRTLLTAIVFIPSPLLLRLGCRLA